MNINIVFLILCLLFFMLLKKYTAIQDKIMGNVPTISQINAENLIETIASGLGSSSDPKTYVNNEIKTHITPIK